MELTLKECVPLTVSYHLYFLCISKVWSMLHHRSWGEFRVKNATLCLYIILWYFLFFIKKFVFLSFSSLFFFDEVSNFRNRLLANQKSESVVTNCQWNCMEETLKNNGLNDICKKNHIVSSKY